MLSLTRSVLLLLPVAVLSFDALTAQTLGPSWRDRGLQMLGGKQFDSAQYYLERWLEADPGDEESWYNLACVHALQGGKEQALTAWENSVAAGWNDAEQPLKDGDLESIRSDERFSAALSKVSERKKAAGPKGYMRHMIETRSVGTYIVALPEDYGTVERDYPLCVILHGSGSTELAHGRLADACGRDDVIYIAPRAPYAHTSSFKGGGQLGYTAWTPEDIDSLDPLASEVPVMYADWIVRCIDDARSRYNVQDGKVLLLGHSQGAAYAYITATLYPEYVRSLFAYAGYFRDEFCTDERLRNLKDQNISLTIAYGENDNVVDPTESKEIDSILTAWDIDHSLIAYEGVGHEIAPQVRAEMKGWMNRMLGRVEEAGIGEGNRKSGTTER